MDDLMVECVFNKIIIRSIIFHKYNQLASSEVCSERIVWLISRF
jgi:hypothetical protein